MARTVWRYTLKAKEQQLWDREDMRGWCRAFEGCVEDEAREMGLKTYIIYDRQGEVVAKDRVSELPPANPVEARRGL